MGKSADGSARPCPGLCRAARCVCLAVGDFLGPHGVVLVPSVSSYRLNLTSARVSCASCASRAPPPLDVLTRRRMLVQTRHQRMRGDSLSRHTLNSSQYLPLIGGRPPPMRPISAPPHPQTPNNTRRATSVPREEIWSICIRIDTGTTT